MSILITSIQHCTEGYSHCKKARKRSKNTSKLERKKEISLFLLTDNLICKKKIPCNLQRSY